MDHIHELMLCEQDAIFLRPNVLYRFTIAEGCAKCLRIARMYEDVPQTIIKTS